MDIGQLKTLLAVAQHGSFAAAARAQDLDPSVVSRQVAATEAQLGVRLFERSTRRLAVTVAGQGYLLRIAPLLEELDRAAEAAREERQVPRGRLRITASVAFGQECLVPLLPAFRAQYPGIMLDLVFTDANLDLVGEGIDLAVRLAPMPTGDLISTRLRKTRYIVCASRAYLDREGWPKEPEDLLTHECLRMLMAGSDGGWRFRKEAHSSCDIAVTGAIAISSPLALREAARDGLGPALLADWLVAKDIAAGRLVPLFADWEATATGFESGAWALYPSRSFMPTRLRVMLDFLKTELRG